MRAVNPELPDGVVDGLARVRRCLMLAPHPDDLDVVAVTLRWLADRGAQVFLEVLTSGASGVEDSFAATWEEKAAAREAEQEASCREFGLSLDRVRFHRLAEDTAGHMRADDGNEQGVRAVLDRVNADLVVLPHGRDSNPDHRRTYRMFARWVQDQELGPAALLVRDPKTLEMRLDLAMPFGSEMAEWKAGLLRCHESQQVRNLNTRGCGLDDRVLEMNREIADMAGLAGPYAEGFEYRAGPKLVLDGNQ